MEKAYLVAIIIDQSSCSLSVINHNKQAHQEEENGASNCKMMKGSSRNELTHYGKFSFHFHPESDAFCCCCSFFKPVFTRPCGCSAIDERCAAECPWIHSSLHLFMWSSHGAVLTRPQLTALWPAQTNQTWRASSSDLMWTAAHEREHCKKSARPRSCSLLHDLNGV